METIWKVTTEGDCEGRNTRELGFFTGNPIDIAFKLANQAIYTLFFTEFSPEDVPDFEPKKEDVTVRFTYGSKYYKNTVAERAKLFEHLIQKRPVDIKRNVQGPGYVTLQLTNGNDTMRQAKINNALNKLTEEEKELLGLSK